jgi:hypothetical protein
VQVKQILAAAEIEAAEQAAELIAQGEADLLTQTVHSCPFVFLQF